MFSDISTYSGDGAAFFAVLIALFFVWLIVAVAFYVVGSIFLMKIFEKAGVQGKWRAWIPFYNSLVLAKLGDMSPWIVLGVMLAGILLASIPVIGWIFSIAWLIVTLLFSWRVGLKLGKDWYWLFLWLIPGVGTLVWLGILAYGSARWNTAVPPAPWAGNFLADKTTWSGIPTQPVGVAPASGSYPPPPPAPPAPPSADDPDAPKA